MCDQPYPQAVIFDLDGVITDTAEFHFQAWQQLAQKLGIEIDRAFNEQLKGVNRADSLACILRHGGQEQVWPPEARQQFMTEKNDLYRQLLANLTPADILPGILPLLAAVRAAGCRIGLASVSENAPQVLASLGLSDRFDFCADARALSHSKPHPEIFLTACQGLGVDPRQSIGIEDAQAGITAINANGMYSVGIGATLTEADYRLNHTGELAWPDLLAHWQAAQVCPDTLITRS
ncbi:beta-phosphoglucomutase [Nissabacter sp. SGAir0207]|uniref:beta-phosphoglucomutase n=1 Tax=Nissabacter sp. SGAir0207 TaxID=2126321 RepID=UPI0010CCBA45|nr:beta-phosphoglucomutase [Nissabacter sp. SGAir0207]QCR34752.1 beta-phosphoglucomutase [Nissabacter sp. SGAir0207]